ncbi:MAG: hypothetical protein ACF8GE_04440 [Phycisphaerales bacterium JB043]
MAQWLALVRCDVVDRTHPVCVEAREALLRRVGATHGRGGDCWQRCGGDGSGSGVAAWYSERRPAYAGARLGEVARSGGEIDARVEVRAITFVRTLNATGRFVDVIG